MSIEVNKSAKHLYAAISESEPSCAERFNKSLTVIVAEDRELIRKSVAALLSYESDFAVLECANTRQLLKLVEDHRPEVVIVDVSLGGVDAIETTKRIKALNPSTRVIVLSIYRDELLVRGLLAAGIGGYVLKSDPAQDLIGAIRGEEGNVHLSPRVAAFPKKEGGSSARAHGATTAVSVLSPRQREVLRLIAQGYSSKRIAAAFGITESTVKSHRKSIMEKLGIHDRVGLTRHAIRIGLTHAE